MTTVADHAAEFARRARRGGRPVARVEKRYAEAFLGELVREGIEIARCCLDEIHDRELRRIIEAVLFGGAAGATLGAAIGGAVGGVPGAKIGAAVGAGVGVVSGLFAVAITLKQAEGPRGPELVVGLA